MMLRSVAILSSLICTALPAFARVATLSTGELTKLSDVIVLAKVNRIFERGNVRVASAGILTRFKGKTQMQTVEFVACQTWTCDTSDAVLGETVLLFLDPANIKRGVTMNGQDIAKASAMASKQGITLFELTHSGRGRVQVMESKGLRQMKVYRYKDGPQDEWLISANHALAKTCKVRSQTSTAGYVLFDDFLTSVKRAL